MSFKRFPIAPLVLVVSFAAVSLYSPVVTAQKARSAHSKKAVQYHYVCPMHEDVTSKKRGSTCPKCKMKLVRKQIPKEQPPASN